MTMLHFIRPWWFLGLIPLAYIWWRSQFFSTALHHWHKACDAHLLPYLALDTQNNNHSWLKILIAIAWFLAVIALAGPAWKQLPEIVYKTQQSRIIIFDLSENMQANDLVPSRLTRARYKLLDLLSFYKTGQTGLIVYSDEPYLVSPLTEDVNTIKNMVPYLSPQIMPVTGSNLANALSMAGKLLANNHVNSGDIIIMTASKANAAAIKKAKALEQQGYHISVLGIGSLNKSPLLEDDGSYLHDNNGGILFTQLDQSNLQDLARAGNGHYVLFSNNKTDINTIVGINTHKILQESKTKLLTNRWQDEGWWLVWPLLIITLAMIILREREQK